jgi:hypothetical protein
MGKLGGLILLAALALTGCAAQAAPAPSESAAPLKGVAPLVAAPAPTATLAPEFTDPTNLDKFLAGVKKNWRGGEIPADDVLVGRGAEACVQFGKGLDMGEIGALGGTTEIEWDNAGAIAVYASRNFCTAYNTDR